MPVTGAALPAREWGAFAWRRGSEVLDTLRGLASSLLIFNGKLCVGRALYGLLSENALPVLPPGPVWSGPAKRAPGETIILEMPRLARAGALHLLPEWEVEEQSLIAIMQQPF